MRAIVVAAVMATALQSAAAAQTEPDIIILGGRDQADFLGCLSCNEMHPDSVWNPMSTHGWENGFGTWNPFGPNKNPFSPNSACNSFALSPPIIVDRRGNYYGELTINEARPGSVCGAGGARQACYALRAMCSD